MQLESCQPSSAPAIITVVETVRGPHKLQVQPFVSVIFITERVYGIVEAGLAERPTLVFQQGQQQARADAEIGRHQVNDLRSAAIRIRGIFVVTIQPAKGCGNEGSCVESYLRRAVHEQAVGYDLVRRSPEREIIDRDFHRHAGR